MQGSAIFPMLADFQDRRLQWQGGLRGHRKVWDQVG